MSLSIMHLWTVSFSQSAALPQSLLQSPLQNEGGQQPAANHPPYVLAQPRLPLCLLAGSFVPRLVAERASIPQLLMPLMGTEDLQNSLKFACTLCCSALLRQLCLG